MNSVWLLYEDDYGGMMSPYVLTAVFPEDQEKEAKEASRKCGWLGRLKPHDYLGSLDLDRYPKYDGGLF